MSLLPHRWNGPVNLLHPTNNIDMMIAIFQTQAQSCEMGHKTSYRETSCSFVRL